MRVLQHNCNRRYAYVQAALQACLEAGAGIACLQEPGDMEVSHPGFLFYRPSGPYKTCRVVTAVRRDLVDRIVVEARTDLVDHPYCLVVDIREQGRCTRVVNCYDAWLGQHYTYAGASQATRRALEEVNWDRIIEGRCLILGDFNAHSPLWNPWAGTRNTAARLLHRLIETHGILINNDPGVLTRLAPAAEPALPAGDPGSSRRSNRPGGSIIDLTLSSQALGPLPIWTVDEERATGLDHQVIITGWDSLEDPLSEGPAIKTTGWRINKLTTNKKELRRIKII